MARIHRRTVQKDPDNHDGVITDLEPDILECEVKWAFQCNPYQATNGILHRARTNNFTICMEIQETSNSQSYLEKEEWNWRNQPT